MPKKLTILVCGVSAVGHVNALAGATRPLISRGHRVIFLLEETFRNKFAPLGFIEHIYAGPKKEATEQNPGEKIANAVTKSKLLGPELPIEKMYNLIRYFELKETEEYMTLLNAAIVESIEIYKPNCIWFDANCFMPAVYYSGIPWVRNNSMMPLFAVQEENLPPGGSGFPSNDRTGWAEFEAVRQEFFTIKSFNDFVQRLGYDRFPNDERTPGGEILHVYAYPDELNYPEIRAKPWFNLDVFNKPPPSDEGVELKNLVPEEFLNDTLNGQFSEKLIYISMGSMASMNLILMKRLVEILAKTNHKYIVAKGPRHEEYSLAKNMFGDRYLPQIQIIPHVDLVITHGGNNTVTETFAIGKPMIVMPFFVDQFDNAQRLQETGFGLRVDPNNFTDAELISSIDKLLYNNGELSDKLKAASKRILSSNRHEELAIEIEKLI